jgi:hypothetical protein
MAINNYTDLKNQVLAFSHRDDIELQIEMFVSLAENEMYNNRVETLNTNIFESTVELTTTVGSDEIELPGDYLEHFDLRIKSNDSFVKLDFKVPDNMSYRSVTGMPCSYTKFGNKIRFDVTTNEVMTVRLDYIQKVSALSESNPTNILLSDNYNIYFFGAMWASKHFSDEPQDAEFWYSKFINSIVGMNNRAELERIGNNPAINFSDNNGIA